MLGKMIRELRIEFEISQTQLAKALGVSKQSVSNWENENILPSIEMLARIASYFGVTCDYLLEMDERTLIDVTGITPQQRALIQKLVLEFQKSSVNSENI